jgi:hypothetical protein
MSNLIFFDDFSTDTTANYVAAPCKQLANVSRLTISYLSGPKYVALKINDDPGHQMWYKPSPNYGVGNNIEAKVKINDITANDQIGVGIRGATKDLICRLLNNGTGSIRLTEFTAVATTELINVGWAKDTNWHTLTMKLFTNTVIILLDNVEQGRKTEYAAESGSFSAFIGYSVHSEPNVDDFKVELRQKTIPRNLWWTKR